MNIFRHVPLGCSNYEFPEAMRQPPRNMDLITDDLVEVRVSFAEYHAVIDRDGVLEVIKPVVFAYDFADLGRLEE